MNKVSLNPSTTTPWSKASQLCSPSINATPNPSQTSTHPSLVQTVAKIGASDTCEEQIRRLIANNAVVIFGFSSCCMCLVAKHLFRSFGANPLLIELNLELDGRGLEQALMCLIDPKDQPTMPAIFVGGKLVGNVDRLMTTHINGALIPALKKAGALWL